MREVLIVKTGVANTASVRAALARRGAEARLCDDAAAIRDARAVVLPGVGSFGSGARALAERGLGDALRGRIESGRATLAVCLGMQLLFDESEESPGVRGLGIARGVVSRFAGNLRVPQMGWNMLSASRGCVTLRSGGVYYANSYRVREAPEGWAAATSDYGGEFVGAMERIGAPSVVACQCHPELSGEWGAALLERWLVGAGERVSC